MDRLSDRWMYYCGILAANGIPVDDLKHIQDLIDAEEQNLLVRLPCKVGDKVYRIDAGNYHTNWKPYVEELTVGEVGYKQEHSEVVLRIVASGLRYKAKNIGKTVFLTREEAEQALKKMEGGE